MAYNEVDLYSVLRHDLAQYDRRTVDYAPHLALNVDCLADATTGDLQADALLAAPTGLQRRLAAEKARRVTTLVQQQEAHFLMIALKPSQLPPASDSPSGSAKSDPPPVLLSHRPDASEKRSIDSGQMSKLSVIGKRSSTASEGKRPAAADPPHPAPETPDQPPVDRRAHYVGSADQLAFAKPSATTIPIITDPPPPVVLRPLTSRPPAEPVASALADEMGVIYDDYDEKELPELPADFGPRIPSRPAPGTQPVDYREIYSKCYRNARRKTRAVLDAEPTVRSVGDLAESRAGEIARAVADEPLCRDWLALGSEMLRPPLVEVDCESLVPVLFLGLEHIVEEADKRGLIPRDPELPVDDVGVLDDPAFDPLEVLGAFLIRHNPKHCSAWESHPYVRSFRRITSQIRNEELATGVKSHSADFEELLLVMQKAIGPPWIPSNTAADGRSGAGKERKAYLHQPANTFMVDGVWNGILPDDCTRVGILQQTEKIMGIMLEWTNAADHALVSLPFLRSCVLSFVQESKTIEYEVKESVRRIMERLLALDESDPTLGASDAARIIGRILGLLKQEHHEALTAHCAACFAASEAERSERNHRMRVGALFDKLDEAKTGFLSRPKVMVLVEEYFNTLPEDAHKDMNDPRCWPVVPVESAYSPSEPYISSLPAGSTPTIFDVDDYQSLLGDALDPLLAIPGAVQEESEKALPSHEHDYVRYMHSEYAPSGSSGILRLPHQDLPHSVSSGSPGKSADKQIDTVDSFARKFAECFDQRQAEKKRHANRPKVLGTVESLPYMDKLISREQLAAVVSNCCPGNITAAGAQQDAVTLLLTYIENNYSESPDERLIRLRQEQQNARFREKNDNLARAFAQLDGDAKGHVTYQYLLDVWSGMKVPIKHADVARALQLYRNLLDAGMEVLDKDQFVDFCTILMESVGYDVDVGARLIGEETAKSIKLTNAEKSRSIMRRGWLEELASGVSCAGHSDASRAKTFAMAVEIVEKDAKMHYGERKVSVSIALLARNAINPYRGKHVLQVLSCSPIDAPFLLHKNILPESDNIGFTVVGTGQMTLIPDTAHTPATLMLNPQRQQITHGPFICHPLLDSQGRCFGVMNVDALGNKQLQSFADSEIAFHQGVIRSLMDGYCAARQRSKLTDATAAALAWFRQRLPSLKDVAVYWPHPDDAQRNVVLKRVITMEKGSAALVHAEPQVYTRDGPHHLQYVLQAVETAQSIRTVSFGDKHVACPILDQDGFTCFVLDINFGEEWLNVEREKSLCNLLVIVQKSVVEMLAERSDRLPADVVLEMEGRCADERHLLTFGRLMLLTHLQPILASIPASVLADIRTSLSVPRGVHHTFQAVLTLLHPLQGLAGRFVTWEACRALVRLDLLQAMLDLDPTAQQLRPLRPGLLDSLQNVMAMDEEEAARGNPLCLPLHQWIATNVQLMRLAERVDEGRRAAQPAVEFTKPFSVTTLQKPRPTFYYS